MRCIIDNPINQPYTPRFSRPCRGARACAGRPVVALVTLASPTGYQLSALRAAGAERAPVQSKSVFEIAPNNI